MYIAPQKRDTHVVKSHVNMLGVNEAMALFIESVISVLEESEISILDIALNVEMPDQSHFAIVFQERWNDREDV